MGGLATNAAALIQRTRGWLGISRMRGRADRDSGRWGSWRQLITTGALRLPPHAEFLLPTVVLLQVLGLVALSKALQGSTDIPPAVQAPIQARSPAVIAESPASKPRDDSTEWSALDRLNEIAAMRPLLERLASDQDISSADTHLPARAAAEPEVAGATTWWEQGPISFHGLLEPVQPIPAVGDAEVIPAGKAADERTTAHNSIQDAQADSRDAASARRKEASGPTAPALPAQENPASAAAEQPATGEQSHDAAASWLRAQEPSHFTLQLLSARQAGWLRKFAASHKLPGPISIVSSMRNGAELFSLVHGVYPTYPSAIAASKKLMAEFKLQQPWARTIESVLAQMTGEESLPGAGLTATAR